MPIAEQDGRSTRSRGLWFTAGLLALVVLAVTIMTGLLQEGPDGPYREATRANAPYSKTVPRADGGLGSQPASSPDFRSATPSTPRPSPADFKAAFPATAAWPASDRDPGAEPPTRDEVFEASEIIKECFDAEARDERWSATTEDGIRSFLARCRSIANASVECRATICLARAVWLPRPGEDRGHAELDSFIEAVKAEAASWGVDLPAFGHSGNQETTLTLRRRGPSSGPRPESCGGLDYEELYSRALSTLDSNAQGEKPPDGHSVLKLKARFEQELPDANWAAGAEESIRSMVNTRSLGAALSPPTVECRATLCQVYTWVETAALADARSNTTWNEWNGAMRRLDDAFEVVQTLSYGEDGDPRKVQIVTTLRRR